MRYKFESRPLGGLVFCGLVILSAWGEWQLISWIVSQIGG